MTSILDAPRRIPTVSEPPLIGSLFALRKNPLDFVRRVVLECGDAGRFHLGPIGGVVFSSSATVQGVLVDKADAFDKGTLTVRAYHTAHSDPVLIEEGAQHRQQRAILDQHFRPESLALYAGIMAAQAEQAISTWQDGAVVDIQQQMMALTLPLMGKILFDIDGLSEDDSFARALTLVPEYLATAVKSPVLLPLWVPTPKNNRVRRAVRIIERRIQALIDDRRGRDPRSSRDLLTVMLTARDVSGNRLEDAQIRDDAVEIFNAGRENVAAALAWCLFLLAQHPEVSTAVHNEVRGVLQGRPPEYSDLTRLPFTLQVVKETLRLYPPVYLMLPRRALHDLEIDGYPVAKGEIVLVSPYAMHHRADYFPEPDRFDPERFTPRAEDALPPHAFMPFGAGPHSCLGEGFALMEAQFILATVVQRVTFTLVEGPTVVPDPALVLLQREGCRLTVRRYSDA